MRRDIAVNAHHGFTLNPFDHSALDIFERRPDQPEDQTCVQALHAISFNG